MKTKHIPVLLKETIENLNIKPSGTYIDATLGGGGHSLKILTRLEKTKNQKSKMIVIDHDREAIQRFIGELGVRGFVELSKLHFKKENIEVILKHSNFDRLGEILKEEDITSVDGIIADLGISTDQLLDSSRGFSFKKGEKLDLRMDDRLKVTGADLLNALYEKELTKLFKIYGDIIEAKQISAEIIRYRKNRKIEHIDDFLKIIKKAVNLKRSRNLFARAIQALRIAVNHELTSLRKFLPQAFESLANGRTLIIISFHSGEDRIVKNFFYKFTRKGLGVTKLIYPTEDEININQKARAAKMRILNKI